MIRDVTWDKWLLFVCVGLVVVCLAGVSVSLFYQFFHKSSSTDETTPSVLPINQGGTGVSTLTELKKKLNIQDLVPVSGGGTGVSNLSSLKNALGLDPDVLQPLSYASGNVEDAKLVNPTMFYDVFGNTYVMSGFYTKQTSSVEIWGTLEGAIVSTAQKRLQGKLPFPVNPASYRAMGSVLSCWAGGSKDDSTDWVLSPAKGFVVQQSNGSVYIYVYWDFGLTPATVGGKLVITFMVKLFAT